MEQFKPLSIKLVVKIDIAEYKQALAKLHNLKPEEIEVVFSEEEEHGFGITPVFPQISVEHIEVVKDDEPTERKEHACGEAVGGESKAKKRYEWLHLFLLEKGFTRREAAELCGTTLSTINRACKGVRLRKENFSAICRGLELDTLQRKAFKNSLKYAQRDIDGREVLE